MDGGLSGIVRIVIIYNVPGLADDNSRFWKLGLPSPTRNVDILTSENRQVVLILNTGVG